ncbi:MAG: SDR family NAD(P)-dependent oxidoreductase [Thiohalomonadales bacterium]
MRKTPNIAAVITGAASGLGYATAKRIVADNGKVVILDIDDVAGMLAQKRLGANALFVKTDVTQEDQVDAAVLRASSFLSGINLAVNCAGVAPSQLILGKEKRMSTAEFARVVTINLVATYSVIRAVANSMQQNEADIDGQRGVIVNTSSIAAYDGQAGQSAYASSKGGVASLTLPLAREFARFGIRVMTIAPGLFKTPLFDRLPNKAIESLIATIPFPKRVGDPDEFAQTVLHIYHNPLLNGSTIRLDSALRM